MSDNTLSGGVRLPFVHAADIPDGTPTSNDNLPQWDLDKLFGYTGYKSPEFEADFSRWQDMVSQFIDTYKGKISRIGGDRLATAMEEISEIGDLSGKMRTYLSSKETQDSVLYSRDVQGFGARIQDTRASDLTFLSYELQAMSLEQLQKKLDKSDALKKWEPALREVIEAKAHALAPEVQKYADEMPGMGHVTAMYERRRATLRFQLDGAELNVSQINNIIAFDPDSEKRAEAQKEFERVMNEESWFNAEVHNGLIAKGHVARKWTHFDNPADPRHASNNIKPEIVDALEDAVKSAYERTSHRFYALKAKLMGQDHLLVSDKNINIFEGGDEQKIGWDKAKEIVLDAYYSFDQRAGEVAQKFFDEGWIDAAPGPNKRGGAYSNYGAAGALHPLVMQNFQGTASDVKTLAHELGHGIHQYMAAHKGDAIISTPLTMAETASVFGEMLTFKSLMEKAENDDQRRKLLFDKVNDMLNTVVRQISFYDFERRTHGQYAETKTPLSAEDFKKHWNDVAHESLGPAVEISEDYGAVFGYIPHLVRSPFYVYAYAFGDSLVNALYQSFEDGDVPEEEFKDKYFAMLEAGGTYKLGDLKDDFGLDVEDPEFWQKGLNLIESMIDELETLSQPTLERMAEHDGTHAVL